MYKLTAITFADMVSAKKFIKENRKFWEVVRGFTHTIVENPLTTTVTVVFAKSANILETILRKAHKSNAKYKCYRELFATWFPRPPKNLNRLPLSMKDLKEFLREALDGLEPPIGRDKKDWKTDLFMVATYMEDKNNFWSAALAVIEWIKQEYAQV